MQTETITTQDNMQITKTEIDFESIKKKFVCHELLENATVINLNGAPPTLYYKAKIFYFSEKHGFRRSHTIDLWYKNGKYYVKTTTKDYLITIGVIA